MSRVHPRRRRHRTSQRQPTPGKTHGESPVHAGLRGMNVTRMSPLDDRVDHAGHACHAVRAPKTEASGGASRGRSTVDPSSLDRPSEPPVWCGACSACYGNPLPLAVPARGRQGRRCPPLAAAVFGACLSPRKQVNCGRPNLRRHQTTTPRNGDLSAGATRAKTND
jgi:hypothetical protein